MLDLQMLAFLTDAWIMKVLHELHYNGPIIEEVIFPGLPGWLKAVGHQRHTLKNTHCQWPLLFLCLLSSMRCHIDLLPSPHLGVLPHGARGAETMESSDHDIVL